MSIYLSSAQKAITGGTGVSAETSLWGMQDQIQLQMIVQALTIHAMTSGDEFLTPSELARTDDPFDNTSANFWSAMLVQQLATPEQLISPNDKGWVEEASYGVRNAYWDESFSVDLQSTSNVSYAHMPLFGERLKRRWNPRAGRFPILGNRGPMDGVEHSNSITLDADGIWRGWIAFADGSIDWQEGATTTSKWRRKDGYVDDNLFFMEDADSSDDAILGLTYEMDDYGPTFVWDQSIQDSNKTASKPTKTYFAWLNYLVQSFQVYKVNVPVPASPVAHPPSRMR